MKTLKRLGIGLLAIIVLVAIGLAVWEPMGVEQPAPPPEGTYEARIVRDEFGVPHIFGKTDADVAYGVAYAHSEDDFSTLQEVTAMTRGRMATLNGSESAPIDYIAALLDVRGTVNRKYDQLPTDVRAVLDGYASGLNAYAAEHPEEVKLAKLFPVNGQDIAAGFVLRSPFFFGLNNPIEALVQNKPLPREGGPRLSDEPVKTSIHPLSPDKLIEEDSATPVGPDPDENGSNAYALAPELSPEGKTRLISNSHQPLRGNVAWYELVVHSEEGWDFAGANFPGSPFPFLGHNKYLGWTNTVNRPDLVDIYKLTLNDKKDAYRFDGEWKALEKKRVWLKIKFGPFVIPYPQVAYRSIHGPVIINDNGAYALRYAGIDELDMLTQYYRINKARNFDEWQAAMAGQGVPATNFIYADAEGNIGMYYNAMFPDRPEGYDWRGILPGDSSKALWQKTLPFTRVPALVNPASGYVMNANNTPYIAAGPGDELKPDNFSPLLGVENDQTNRSRRSIALLERANADGKITDSELWAIKYDTGYEKAGYAKDWLDRIAALDLKDSAKLLEAQQLLVQWDWNLDGKGPADALALMVLRPANKSHYNRGKMPDPREILQETVGHLTTYFDRIDPPMMDVLRMRQGDVDLPVDGGNDTIRASTLWDVEGDGRLSVRHGDSFIMFMEWTKDGKVHSRSIQPFGAATTRPDSPHYTDQMQMFVDKKLKPVRFDPAELEKHKTSDKVVRGT
ncbi:penicillin acylase family protein [Sphingorhabdus sp. 109]|uniref:penicillin acylase family protein n=1 Tax=Sphingorhabdus sp. 109 TaxID=2653173 RepID=UPI001F30444E|nr:acylase [Sphingorhabdus sp. 109]